MENIMHTIKGLFHTAIAVVLYSAIASLLTANTFAQSNLTVSPAVVVFPNTPVGPDCPGNNCSYAMVTIANNGAQDVTLGVAEADPSQTFWATYGGTCNVVYAYVLPAGQTCTFQWGFAPPHPGKFMGTGTISFADGSMVGVVLTGKGTTK